jgi:hypothetical protein
LGDLRWRSLGGGGGGGKGGKGHWKPARVKSGLTMTIDGK